MFKSLEEWLAARDVGQTAADLAIQGAMWLTVLVAALLTAIIARRVFAPLVERVVRQSSNRWDDTLVQHNFFRKLAAVLPLIAVMVVIDLLFQGLDPAALVIRRLVLSGLVLVGVRVVNSFIGTAVEIYNSYDVSREVSLKGYAQVLEIILWVLAAILVAALLANKSPWGIMSVFGGLTAILLLIFKDTILGFVASLQISANNMVRIGDWIEMPAFGADGDVVDVSIHTVKVRNWDKTISTIPTYALVSNSFKNWRGMTESGGRRIKRALYLDMNSVRFCDSGMLERFGKFELIKDYLANKEADIENYNRDRHCDSDSCQLNGRRQTNLGVFRAYVIAYLKNNPNIHQDMTFLVRHLAPTAQGLPLEIYVFSKDQVWANYEGIQADIFDHLLAVVPLFDLRVFQYPSGHDLAGFAGALQAAKG